MTTNMLSISRSLAAAWIWLYTAGASANEREARRSELLSDLHDHVEAEQAEGRSAAAIATQVVLRVVGGMKDDVAWSAPQLPRSLPERLESGSETLRHPATLRLLVPIVALLGMVNWIFMSDDDLGWPHFLLLNIISLAVIVLMANHERPWARRVLNAYFLLMIAVTAAVILWVTVEYRLYETPILDQTLLRIEPAALLNGGIVMVALTVAFIVMCLIFTILSVIVCYSALNSSASGMRLMAQTIRRLT